MKKKLAVYGGKKLIKSKFSTYRTIGKEEITAATEVLKSGVLSGFEASKSKKFFGGKFVRKFEEVIKKFFNVKYAVTVNSWTSGISIAVGSLDIEPGDEIIVSPWTMTATASAILHWNAIPVFVDIDPKNFCLDPKKIEKKISSKTKAIIVVDIFGKSADMNSINKIAKKHGLKVISDSAQAIGSVYKGKKYSGTFSDIGGFSLNYHKHIHTGEGGIAITNSYKLARKMMLLRNHAETVLEDKKDELTNMIGHNYRLGEIEAAIGIQQFKKLKNLLKTRIKAAQQLTRGLKNLKGLILPKTNYEFENVFYVYPIILDKNKINIKKKTIFNALVAEGVPALMSKYINLHTLPLYQKKIGYGKKGFPWSLNKKNYNYKKGICPVAEEFNDKYFLGIEMCKYNFNKQDIKKIINAFKKVWANLI